MDETTEIYVLLSAMLGPITLLVLGLSCYQKMGVAKVETKAMVVAFASMVGQ